MSSSRSAAPLAACVLFLFLLATAFAQRPQTRPVNPPAVPGVPRTPPSGPTRNPFQTPKPAPPKPKPPPRSLLFGMNFDFTGGSPAVRIAKSTTKITLMQEVGVTNARIAARWADIERVRGKYDWGALDEACRLLKARGFDLICVVETTPAWASEVTPAIRKAFDLNGLADRVAYLPPRPSHYADLARFAAALGARYKLIVHRWEFGNEPDGAGMPVTARGSGENPILIRYGAPDIYAALLETFSRNIKQADPKCLVAVGGLAAQRTDFLNALYGAGAQKAFDAVCLHPSSGAHPLAFDWIDACRDTLIEHGEERKKFWLTEWGWRTYPGDPAGIVEGEQARFLRLAFAEMRRRPYIEAACLLPLDDWRAKENDPLSLVATGLMTRELKAKPGFYAFLSAATGKPEERFHGPRIGLVAGPAPAEDAEAHLDVYADTNAGVLPNVWAGVSVDPGDGALSAANGEKVGARLKARGVFLTRRFSVRTESALSGQDALLKTMAQTGVGTILALTPDLSETAAGWEAQTQEAARRYGAAPAFGVTRWEMAAPHSVAKEFYPAFARAVRRSAPAAPIGWNLETGDPLEAVSLLALWSRQGGVSCDSLAWRTESDPTEEAQRLRRLRAALAPNRALRSLTLWPEIHAEESSFGGASGASRLVALAARLLDYAPAGEANGLGGALLALPDAVGTAGNMTPGGNALALLNRLKGIRLRAESDDSGVRCLAARDLEGTVSALVWREGEGAQEEAAAVLQLHGLRRNKLGGWRLEQYVIDAVHHGDGEKVGGLKPAGGIEAGVGLTPVAQTDLPEGAALGDAALPLTLSPGCVTLIQLHPARPSALQVTLSSDRFAVPGGEEATIQATLRNLSKTPQRADLVLSSEAGDAMPSALGRLALGTLAPGKSRAVQFHFPTPQAGQDVMAYINVRAGTNSHAAIAVKLAATVIATLETPRIDLSDPRDRAVARIRLVNRARTETPISLSASANKNPNPASPEEKPFLLPGDGKPVIRSLSLPTPSAYPGLYPVDIDVDSLGQSLATLKVLVGVPVPCKRAVKPPNLNGDLSDWTDAEPMGMGRADQVRNKLWAGPADLSAIAYAKWDDRFFYFACAVTDDVFYQPFTGAQLWQGDSVQFALSTDRSAPPDRIGYGAGDHEFGLALSGDKSVLVRLAGPPGTVLGPVPHSVVAVRRAGTHTYYEAAIPWSELAPATPKAGAIYGFSVLVNDNDGQGRGWIEWGGGIGGGKRPGLFPPLRLVR